MGAFTATKCDLKNTRGVSFTTQGLSERVAMELKVRSWTVFFNKR